MPNPNSPPGESSADIFSEHTWLQGVFLACVAYGMQAILFAMASQLLWKARKPETMRRNIGLIAYISVIFLLATLYMAGLLQFTQQAFIDDRNIDGGPNYYENAMFSIPIDMLANVLMVMLTWMCDIINVWRCFVIYRGSRIPMYVVITIPILLYLASVSTGMLFLKQVGTVSASPWDTPGINWTIPYYTMSLALNILVTILIVLRLLLCRSRVISLLGKKHGAQYTSVAAMIIESAAIYSTFSLLFLIPFTLNKPTSLALSQLFLQALSPVQVFSTLLIVFRVAQGKSWSQKTAMTISQTDATRSSGATRTIGGTSLVMRNPGVRVQTDTAIFAESGKEAVTLQTLDKNRSVNFNELESRGSGREEEA